MKRLIHIPFLFILAAVAACVLASCNENDPVAALPYLTCRAGNEAVGAQTVGSDVAFVLPAAGDVSLVLDAAADSAVTVTADGVASTVEPGGTLALSDPLPASLTVTSGGRETPVTLLRSGNVPALFLHIDESRGTVAAMESDLTKQTACYGDGVLLAPDGSTQQIGSLTLSGRGNSTWQEKQKPRKKQPYKLTLSDSADLLGMGKSRKWALLALYDDPSLIRNRLGLSIAEELDFNYVPSCEPVDLYINGVCRGTYTLSERITVASGRLEMPSLENAIDAVLTVWNTANGTAFETLSDLMTAEPDACRLAPDGRSVTVTLPTSETTLDLTGGYLLEIDYYRDTPQLELASGTKITVKSPDNLAADMDDPLFAYLRGYLTDAEASLSSSNDRAFLAYFDPASFARMWLLREFVMDFDSCVSLYMTLLPGDRLEAGPVWDLENVFALRRDIYGDGDPAYQVILNGGFHGTTASWMTMLSHRAAFMEAVKASYETYASAFDGERVASRAEEMLSLFAPSAAVNARLYPEKVKEDEAVFLPAFIRKRAAAFPQVVDEAVRASNEIKPEEVVS